MALIVADSSVLIALLDARDALHEPAVDELARTWEAGDEILVPSIAYAETMVRPLAEGGEALAQAERFFASQRIVPVGQPEALEAARLRSVHGSRLRLPDALIVATGTLLGATVLTADAGWGTFSPSIRIIGDG